MDDWKRWAVTALLLTLCAPAVWAKDVDRTFHQRFEVERGARLQLVHGDGDVTVTPWDQAAIEVDVAYHATFRKLGLSRDVDFTVDFRQSGDTVRVVGEETGFGGVGFFHLDRQEYSYRVRAPHWVVLDLEGDDGDVTITGWRAAIELELDDGDLRLRDVAGPKIQIELQDGDTVIDGLEGELIFSGDDGEVEILDCKSSRARIEVADGDLVLDRFEGDLAIVIDDGNLRLAKLRASRLAIEGEDGDVTVELLPAPGDLEVAIETDDGDVELTLAAEISARFEIKMDDGRVDVDLPDARDVERREHRVDGVLGDGRGKIRIETADGRVVLRSR